MYSRKLLAKAILLLTGSCLANFEGDKTFEVDHIRIGTSFSAVTRPQWQAAIGDRRKESLAKILSRCLNLIFLVLFFIRIDHEYCSTQTRLYPCRTAGGDRHHRNLDWHVIASRATGSRSGQAIHLFEQHATNWAWPTHNFESGLSRLPTAGDCSDGYWDPDRQLSPVYDIENMGWAYQILPFMEQNNLYDQRVTDGIWLSGNPAVAEQSVATFVCPTRGQRISLNQFFLFPIMLSDYAGVAGWLVRRKRTRSTIGD